MKINDAVKIICGEAEKLLRKKDSIIIAIDGRCAAGKTTLAKVVKEKTACNIIHTDDFFLRDFQRTEERLSAAGGNVDYERILEEVLIPLKAGKTLNYRPFDCKMNGFKQSITVIPKKINIVEGAYSCHPELEKYYDLCVFAEVQEKTQKERILLRNKENAAMFFERWIPLEEKYFNTYKIKDRCKLIFELTEKSGT